MGTVHIYDMDRIYRLVYLDEEAPVGLVTLLSSQGHGFFVVPLPPGEMRPHSPVSPAAVTANMTVPFEPPAYMPC